MADFLGDVDVPSVIAQDECLYCFETSFNDLKEGTQDHTLNTCITCFQAVCPRHTDYHLRATRNEHNLYMNIRRVLRLSPDEDSANKKPRLEVVEKSIKDTYDAYWQLQEWVDDHFQVIYDSQSPGVPVSVSMKAELIVNARSQRADEETKTWRLEMAPCKHVREFRVDPNLTIHNIGTCSSCELSENLWLCLHCGFTGCGRDQVGIRGNSHALTHYQQNMDHPLAIKLGSLSVQSYDLHCYSCDDEVTWEDDRTLYDMLRSFGIKIDSIRSNEKTLVDLQVDQNMSWEFQMVDDQGNDLESLSPKIGIGCGLINLGNSCYLNSVIQCILNGGIHGWQMDSIGNDFPTEVVFPGSNLKCQLIKLNNAINCEPSRYTMGIRPASFKLCIGKGHEEFSTNRQQDAMEFFSYFINELDSKVFKDPTSNPTSLLKFITEERIECQNCKQVKYLQESNETLQLPLAENDNPQYIMDRIKDYCNGKALDYFCPTCQETTCAIKSSKFETFPDTLIINPLRIKLENWKPVKTNNELHLPGVGQLADELLDISEFKATGFDPQNEKLMPEDGVFQPLPDLLQELLDMGFSENASARALYTTGNNSLEQATEWLFQHIDDADLNNPLQGSDSVEVDSESLLQMCAMGIEESLAKRALLNNSGDVERSVEWVFSGAAEQEVDEPKHMPSKQMGHSEPRPYILRAAICHKGASAHSGHYVAFIKKEIHGKDQWVLYNDERIVLNGNPTDLSKNGYVYLYQRL